VANACFTAGTPFVVDLEGHRRPMEEIQEGDRVLARSEFDPQGPLELKRVEEKFVRTAAVMELVINGQSIKTTAEHPFYVPAQERFVPAGELRVGDLLVSSQRTLIPIESIASLNEITTVYNLRGDEPHGPLELKRVEELFTRTSPIIELEIGGQKIGTTDEHPFYVPAREAFVPARELQVGDQLISHDGQLLRIDAIQSTLQIATVYNLRVTDYHTYFVGCDEWGWSVWAHNAKCGPALVNSREFRESHTRIFGDAGSSGHPTIIAQLQKHANTAAQRAKYTERQLASIQRSKNRAAAATDVAQREKHLRIAARKEKLFMGTQVDTEFKTLVADDPMIKSLGLSITPRGRFGPDIYDAKTKDYWELTTKADWLRGTHQNRYNGHFANGTGVFWS
jgi:intein/homing endonuclease